MTAAQLNTLINFKCSTNDTTFPQATKLPLVNMFKNEISSRIVESNKRYFLVPATFSLVADQREYSLDDNMLSHVQKLELKFVSTDAYQPSVGLKEYYGSETESEIVKEYTNIKGGFAHYIRRRSLFILSGTIIAVTNGGRLWYNLYPADLANLTDATDLAIDPSTTTFGFPRQFHDLLARRVAIEYKGSQPKQIPLSPLEQRYEDDLKDQLDAISRSDNGLEIIGSMPDDADTGNNGWDF